MRGLAAGAVATLLALTVAVVVQAAVAKSPPVGKYGCVIGSGAQYAGELYILDASHYKLNSSKAGVYVAKGGKLTFPSGVFKGLMRGRFYVTTSHRTEIALTSLASGFESEYCDFGT